MASSKYERELRFISTETKRLENELAGLKEALPDTPADAARKAEDVEGIQEKLSELYSRKKEIEESFVAAGMEVPDITKSINENGCRDTVADSDYVPPAEKPAPSVKPAATEEELGEQIKDITDELMQLEIKMLRADVDGDESEKLKLKMSASSLRNRREYLVGQMKALRDVRREQEPAQAPVDDGRLEALEADNRALRSQISDIRTDVTDIKEQLRQILEALRLE